MILFLKAAGFRRRLVSPSSSSEPEVPVTRGGLSLAASSFLRADCRAGVGQVLVGRHETAGRFPQGRPPVIEGSLLPTGSRAMVMRNAAPAVGPPNPGMAGPLLSSLDRRLPLVRHGRGGGFGSRSSAPSLRHGKAGELTSAAPSVGPPGDFRRYRALRLPEPCPVRAPSAIRASASRRRPA